MTYIIASHTKDSTSESLDVHVPCGLESLPPIKSNKNKSKLTLNAKGAREFRNCYYMLRSLTHRHPRSSALRSLKRRERGCLKFLILSDYPYSSYCLRSGFSFSHPHSPYSPSYTNSDQLHFQPIFWILRRLQL